MFRGSYVAIVTPFKNGKIDEKAFAKLIEMHAKAGTDGIVPCGTTGESPTLTVEEHEGLIALTVKLVNKRMKVMAGTGSNSTAEAIEYSQAAEKAGADGCLIVNPYYNKPTQAGLLQHFQAVAASVKIPIVVYNILGRTGVNVSTPVMAELAKIKNITGVKEASGDLSQMSEVINACGQDFDVLSGDDALTLPLLAVGGHGVISVVANIIPKDVKAMITAFNSGDIKKAQAMHRKMLPLVKAMFIETNPIPVKAAMAIMGLIDDEIRLPMTKPAPEAVIKLKKAMKDYGIKF
ncbi:MAG: 4-hydroxy-tetrahydrodipicolinate synthase [Candidatus Goldiibacteriota bacterium HGW-Goldbacteria-1]|jgi:4-hydroxy-tetrahydrodipicolinate synthase|nr:MAG: 4-hydroxy-tetrahydrodipicolinate synthase [Candidatus Goldiibacteriota bacterium HGW-Goldbacteria-1]